VKKGCITGILAKNNTRQIRITGREGDNEQVIYPPDRYLNFNSWPAGYKKDIYALPIVLPG
jgi:hypothetical protein